MQGHVDAVGTLRLRTPEADGSQRVEFAAPEAVLRYVVEKGSITVDGISLTVAASSDDGFAVAVIPHTLAVTTLGTKRQGDPVNLEVDVVAKYVERLLEQSRRLRNPSMPFTEIEQAIEAIARGEIVVVVDDADRENEGDLIIAAEKMTPETMAFMIRHTSGVICMPVEGSRLDELRIPLMVADNTESQRTAFTVSVDARHGTTTGISAADRCTTVHAVLDDRDAARGPRPPRSHLPAALPGGWRAQARRPHRGGRRPRASRRPRSLRACSPRS